MKIAIMTQPLGHNYGGIMQAYALQIVLKRLGHKPITINRQKDRPNLAYNLALRLKFKINNLSGKPHLSPKDKRFILNNMYEFIDQNISITKPIYSNKKLIKHFRKNRYDAVVVGSDQVWRPTYAANIYNNFLDFKRHTPNFIGISYAASFGVDTWEYTKKQTTSCLQLVKNFAAVSVRESDAVQLCKENLNTGSELVLDPTLLLLATDYESLVGVPSYENNKGILTYILDSTPLKTKFINKISNQLNLPTFSNQPRRKISDVQHLSLDEYKYPRVEDWLKSFIQADFVVTDSFHGCAFSIIFNKPFLALGNKSRGISRFTSLLSLVGLEDRLVLDYNEIPTTKLQEYIDWNEVNQQLDLERKKSLGFLKKWLVST